MFERLVVGRTLFEERFSECLTITTLGMARVVNKYLRNN